MRELIQCNGVAFEADNGRWVARGILKLFVYEEDFEYMCPVIQPYPQSAVKPWAELHNSQLGSLPVTLIYGHADKTMAYAVALQCYEDNQLCVTDINNERLTVEAVMLYLWHEVRKAEERVGRPLRSNNARCLHAAMQVIKQQGIGDLLNVGVSDETVVLSFKHIFIGVEHDGYAHS